MMRPRWLFAFFLVALAALAYAPALTAPYYADDFQLVFLPPPFAAWEHVTQASPHNAFYRPLQNAFLHLVQQRVGLAAWPAHVLALAMHLTLAGLTAVAARRLGATRRAAGLAAVLVALGQAATSAVIGVDTLSQVGGALFGWAAVLAAAQRGPTWRMAVGATLLLAMALWSKETAAPFALLAVGAAVWRCWGRPKDLLARTLPLALVTLCYLWTRALVASAQPEVGEGLYTFSLGLGVLRNAALLTAAAASLVPTPLMARLAATGATAWLVLGGVASAVALGWIAWGWKHARPRPRVALVLLVLAGVSVLPTPLLGRVSELYVYNAWPPLALLAGLGLAGASRRHPRLGWSVAAALVLVHAAGTFYKASLAAIEAERANVLLPQVVEAAERLPKGATLDLVQPRALPAGYSVYDMPGWSVLHFSEHVLQHRAGRPDVEVRIVHEVDAGSHALRLCAPDRACADVR